MLTYAFVLVVGLVSGAVSGIVGAGSSIMLLPVLVFQFGPRQAVPIMAIAALMSNVAKVMAWWREVDWRAFAAFSIPGVPAAALGARTLLVLPARVVDIALGAFFLAMIALRRGLRARDFHIGLRGLALAGAAIGFVTGVVLSTGPLSVPVFLAFGLSKGAFLSTEAARLARVDDQQGGDLPRARSAAAALDRSRTRHRRVGDGRVVRRQAIVQRVSTHAFHYLLDALLLCSGLSLLWAAVVA